MTRWRWLLAGVFGAVVLGLTACGDDNDNPVRVDKDPIGGDPEGAVPAFSLPDVNPNSATHDTAVSPRDYLEKVSAWYFGHST